MGVKQRKARKRIDLFGKKEENYKSDIGDKIDPN